MMPRSWHAAGSTRSSTTTTASSIWHTRSVIDASSTTASNTLQSICVCGARSAITGAWDSRAFCRLAAQCRATHCALHTARYTLRTRCYIRCYTLRARCYTCATTLPTDSQAYVRGMQLQDGGAHNRPPMGAATFFPQKGLARGGVRLFIRLLVQLSCRYGPGEL